MHSYIEKRQDCTVLYPNRELCIVISKKTRRNRSPSQQRTLHYYIEQETKNRCPSEPWTLHCYIETSKAEPFPNPNRELCIVTSKKAWLNRSPSQQRTLHCYLTKSCSVTTFHMQRQKSRSLYQNFAQQTAVPNRISIPTILFPAHCSIFTAGDCTHFPS